MAYGGGAVGIVHYMVRREPSADETVVVGPLFEFSIQFQNFRKEIPTKELIPSS